MSKIGFVVTLDSIDRQLVHALCEDGRATYAELGALVRLSPNSVADRVRRLRRDGVIRKFAAVLDTAVLGKPLNVVSDVKLREGLERIAFAESLYQIPEVIGAVRLTGANDYQLRIVAADTDELEGIIDRLKREFGVASINSRLVLREVPLEPSHLVD